MSFVARYTIRLCQRVRALVTRASVKARWDFESDLSYCVAVLAVFGARPSPVRINGIVNVSTVSVNGGSLTVKRVRGAWELACRLVSGVIMSAVGSNSIRAYRAFMFEHQSVFSAMRPAWERWLILLGDGVSVGVRFRVLDLRKNRTSDCLHATVARKAGVNRGDIVNREQCASIMRVRRVENFKVVVVGERGGPITGRAGVCSHVRDTFCFPLRVKVNVARVARDRRL